VGVYAHFQANLKESHLTAVKRIIRYVNDTLLYGIWYSRETNLVVVGYSDAAGLEMLMIERALQEDVSMWGTIF
jgi:hypothetical protein